MFLKTHATGANARVGKATHTKKRPTTTCVIAAPVDEAALSVGAFASRHTTADTLCDAIMASSSALAMLGNQLHSTDPAAIQIALKSGDSNLSTGEVAFATAWLAGHETIRLEPGLADRLRAQGVSDDLPVSEIATALESCVSIEAPVRFPVPSAEAGRCEQRTFPYAVVLRDKAREEPTSESRLVDAVTIHAMDETKRATLTIKAEGLSLAEAARSLAETQAKAALASTGLDPSLLPELLRSFPTGLVLDTLRDVAAYLTHAVRVLPANRERNGIVHVLGDRPYAAADLIASWGYAASPTDWEDEALYRAADGHYCVVGEGGADTPYGVQLSDGTWAGSGAVDPFDIGSQREFAERHPEAMPLLEAFGATE